MQPQFFGLINKTKLAFTSFPRSAQVWRSHYSENSTFVTFMNNPLSPTVVVLWSACSVCFIQFGPRSMHSESLEPQLTLRISIVGRWSIPMAF